MAVDSDFKNIRNYIMIIIIVAVILHIFIDSYPSNPIIVISIAVALLIDISIRLIFHFFIKTNKHREIIRQVIRYMIFFAWVLLLTYMGEGWSQVWLIALFWFLDICQDTVSIICKKNIQA